MFELIRTFWKKQGAFIILAVIVSSLLSNSCVESIYDSDPLYGSNECLEYINFSGTRWLANAFGIWIAFNVGAFFREADIKDNFKQWTRKNISGWGIKFEEMQNER